MSKQKSPLAIVAVLGLSIMALLACGESSAAVATNGGGNSSSASSQHFKAGQQVKFGDFVVTVNSVKTSTGDELTTPKAGNIILVVDVTIKNTSSKSQDVSSALDFTLQDATGQKYDETIISNGTPPDGSVPAGGLLRGQLAYEVPKAQHKFTFSFQPDITSSDQAIWDLTD